MAKNNRSCRNYPAAPNGKPSKLFNELMELTGRDRELSLLIYSYYQLPGVPEAMDRQGYVYHNKETGEHSYRDLLRFWNFNDMLDRHNMGSNESLEVSNGFKTQDKEYVKFQSAEDAMRKAIAFNDAHTAKVASVYQNGEGFNVIVNDNSATNNVVKAQLVAKLQIWDTFKNDLAAKGISLDNLAARMPDYFNPIRLHDAVELIRGLKMNTPTLYTESMFNTLLSINSHIPAVASVISRLGSTPAEVGANVYAAFHDPASTNYAQSFISLIKRTVIDCYNGTYVNPVSLAADYTNIERGNTTAGQAVEVQNIAKTLKHKFKVASDDIKVLDDKLNKLSDVVVKTMMNMERQLDHINRMEGPSAKTLALRDRIINILDDLEHKQYSLGLIGFMQEANSMLSDAMNGLSRIATMGEDMESCVSRADYVIKAKKFYDSYDQVISALSKMDTLGMDENLLPEDIEILKTEASSLRTYFDRLRNAIDLAAENIAADIYKNILGDSPVLAEGVMSAIKYQVFDDSIFRNLYSMGRTNNVSINVLYSIIDIEKNRVRTHFGDYAKEIQAITKKYRKQGLKNTDFMYEQVFVGKDEDIMRYYIASPYDWQGYFKEYYKARAIYKASGYKGPLLDAMMQKWEEQETIEVVVDPSSGRTERVPGASFVNPNFQRGWTQAQIGYYNEMMDLKGRLGTLLPEHARKQFVPPQRRKDWKDVMKYAIKKHYSLSDAVKLLLNKSAIWKDREDSEDVSAHGIFSNVENEEFTNVRSNYDDTPVNAIPIFNVHMLKNQKDLDMDFSGSLQTMANSAVSYNHMNKIASLVEVMSDQIKKTGGVQLDKNGRPVVTRFETKDGAYVKLLKKIGVVHDISSTIDQYIDAIFLGNSMATNNAMSRLMTGLVHYNSYKGLALNEKGGIANLVVGQVQNTIEACAGKYCNHADINWALHKLIGVGGLTDGSHMGGELFDWLADDTQTKVNLLKELFDPNQDFVEGRRHERYFRGFLRKALEDGSLTYLYTFGEDILHLVNLYALLHHERVTILDSTTGERKEISLFDAFEKVNDSRGVASLKVKDGVARLNGQLIDEDYLKSIRDNVKTLNQKCHGAMNDEDKGLFARTIIGKMALNFRQWAIETLSKRYRGVHYDATAGDVLDINMYGKHYVMKDGEKMKLKDAFDRTEHSDGSFTISLSGNVTDMDGRPIDMKDLEMFTDKLNRENHIDAGFYADMFKILTTAKRDISAGMINLAGKEMFLAKFSDKFKHSNIRENQVYNIRRVFAELSVIASLFCLTTFIFGKDDKFRNKRILRMFDYQARRALQEELSLSPLGVPTIATSYMHKPFPVENTINGLMYPITGLMAGDYSKRVQSGDFEGMRRYYRNCLKYTIPLWNNYQKIKDFADDPHLFDVFESDYSMR